MEEWMNQFIALVDGVKLVLLMALIAANFLTGIAVSIYTKQFRLKMVADFLVGKVLPYVLCYFAVGLVALFEPDWAMAVPIVWGVILLSLVGAILTNLKELGINLPDSLAGKPPV